MSVFYLTPFNLTPLISALEHKVESVLISPNLNISLITLPLTTDSVELGDKSYSLETLQKLRKSLKGVLLIEQGREERLEFFAGHYYKLRPTVSAPTLEIDGIQMHRTKLVDPWEDARRKASHAVRSNDIVLDTCSGLGYTAIWAVKLGAKTVISCEKDRFVLQIREKSPYSRLLKDDRILQENCDVFDKIRQFPPQYFDAVIHDPPRFSLAGELYGQEFYHHLHRVLKFPGRLFHYTGDPFSHGRGKKFLLGIIDRLQSAGFETEPCPQDLGVKAVKIRH